MDSHSIAPRLKQYDCIVIGGGFFGACIALQARKSYQKVLLIERLGDLLLHASLKNQARVHNGYHYPRSLSTALSSARHFRTFCTEFAPAIMQEFDKYYCLARIGSKTSSTQFYRLFTQFDIPIEPAPNTIKSLCDPYRISDVFRVQEFAFNANVLRDILKEKLESSGIEILYHTRAHSVEQTDQKQVIVHITPESTSAPYPSLQLRAPLVLNCTYAGINTLLINSNLSPLSLKYELTEMALVQVPDALDNLSFTIMDGAFFSLMPYPARKCYTLSHVRYTPHCAWVDSHAHTPESNRPDSMDSMDSMDSGRDSHLDPYALLRDFTQAPRSNFPLMLADATRYIPLLESLQYIDSLYEIKTLQTKNEFDDGRPIVFAKDYGIQGFCTIMGGKIDNIYEITHYLHTELGFTL